MRRLTAQWKRRRVSGSQSAGFTLIELLGVMAIIVVLVAISVPAFNGMLASSRASLADGALRSALVQARDAALQSIDGQDSAAVFFFEPGGKVSIVVCTEAGALAGVGIDRRRMTRDVFVADPTYEVQTLPPFFHVNGLVRANQIDENATDDRVLGGWYSTTRYARRQVNWVFPETGFFIDDVDEYEQGAKRQTFLVRFQARTGELDLSEREALVYAPSVTLERSNDPFDIAAFRPDRKSDHKRMIRQLLNVPDGGGFNSADRQKLIGDISTDTVLVRPVREVALYDLRELVRELRAERVGAFTGIDRGTRSLYRSPAQGGEMTPEIDPRLVEEVNRLLPRVAEIFSIDRYSGTARRMGIAEAS